MNPHPQTSILRVLPTPTPLVCLNWLADRLFSTFRRTPDHESSLCDPFWKLPSTASSHTLTDTQCLLSYIQNP